MGVFTLRRTLVCFVVGLAVVSCTQDTASVETAGGTTNYDNPSVFFSTMTSMTVEIAYEPGAEPYTGNAPAALGGYPLWQFVRDNLQTLFVGRTITVTVPTTIEEMSAIPAQNKTSFTDSDILAIAGAYRKGRSTATTGSFFLVLLNGYYNLNGAQNTSVIGVNIAGTTVTALFKPVILSTALGTTLATVPKYVELSTAVHEVGHALGLVNNGIPLFSQHQDAANGKHCNNALCVLYYQNDGVVGLKNFVTNFVITGSTTTLYDENCRNDAKNYHP